MYAIAVFLAGLILTLTLGFLIREALIMSKRPARTAELRHHIEMMNDRAGCENAEQHLMACLHINTHYGIDLAKAGFDGTPDELCTLGYRSFGRYVESFRIHCIENWSLSCEPDELGLVVPIAEGCSGFESVQLYAKAQRKLKRLERSQRTFLARTRVFLGAVFYFSLHSMIISVML